MDSSTLLPPTPTTPSAPSAPSLSPPSKLLFKRHLDHLQLALHPLLSVQNGDPHPCFPTSILHYHLLTEAQLDDLAHFYHQRTPSALSLNYPAPVIMRWEREAGIEAKRRRFGRFIGLRGCETPALAAGQGSSSGSGEQGNEGQTEQELERELEARMRRMKQAREERDMWARKGF